MAFYTRAVKSPFSDDLAPPKGLTTLTESLQRLGGEVTQTRSTQDYNAGRTTQVQTGRVVTIRGRIRRKLGNNGIFLSFERG